MPLAKAFFGNNSFFKGVFFVLWSAFIMMDLFSRIGLCLTKYRFAVGCVKALCSREDNGRGYFLEDLNI